MKKIFILFLSTITYTSYAQSLCASAEEGDVLTMTAPPGQYFTKLIFASYGTPGGECGNYTLGGCSSVSSWSICYNAVIGQNSVSISASNAVFGDPCPGTAKRLYIEAVYSSSLPVKLVSFTAQKMDNDKVRLTWKSESEQRSSHFIIEKSIDGTRFDEAGRINAAGNAYNYSFISTMSTATAHYYRLKMVDIDNRYEYSNIIKVARTTPSVHLTTYPGPVSSYLTIQSTKNIEAIITNSTGQKIRTMSLINGSQTLDVTEWKPGIYFITTVEGSSKFVKL